MTSQGNGTVSLIGAGPGDPELITLKAIKRLRNADIVFHDKLSPSQLIGRYCNPDVVVEDVGKRKGKVGPSQNEINEQLLEASRTYQHVVRLKGGDPYLFGRGGEEALFLEGHGVDFEVIPGISSLLSVPNYAGVPATLREHSSSLAVFTGHLGSENTDLPWEALAKIDTLVAMMGITRADTIANQLIEAGRDSDTPVAVIGWGTTSQQTSTTMDLGELANGLDNPSQFLPGLIVIGDVVENRNALNWFEQKPLFGKQIIITRPEEQTDSIVDLLRDRGAKPMVAPTIEITPRPDGLNELDDTFSAMSDFDWIVFTSRNGVRFFFERLKKRGYDGRILGGINTATIGRKTAESLEDQGINADLVPDQYRAEDLADSLIEDAEPDSTFLLPRAEGARDILRDRLEEAGHRVREILTYRSEPAVNSKKQFERWLENNTADMITFTSASTVDNLFRMYESRKDELTEWLASLDIATIGPITAQRLEARNLSVDVIPEQYTIEHLVGAIETHYRNNQTERLETVQ